MIRDITIGRYYMTQSSVHSLDPRFKILAITAYVVTLFLLNDLYGYLFAALALAVVIGLSKVPIKFMLQGIKSIFVIILITAFLNVFITPGENIIFKIGPLSATMEGVYMAIKIIVRLIMLILSSSLLTLTTTPIALTDGIEYLLKPFKKIGVPAHEIAMMMTIALRFIPTLLDETDKIIKAQQGRGADFETGNILEKAKKLVPILVPLFISAFRRADELADAMEARCYRGGENRTRMNVMKFTKLDIMGSVFLLLYLAIIVAIIIIF